MATLVYTRSADIEQMYNWGVETGLNADVRALESAAEFVAMAANELERMRFRAAFDHGLYKTMPKTLEFEEIILTMNRKTQEFMSQSVQ